MIVSGLPQQGQRGCSIGSLVACSCWSNIRFTLNWSCLSCRLGGLGFHVFTSIVTILPFFRQRVLWAGWPLYPWLLFGWDKVEPHLCCSLFCLGLWQGVLLILCPSSGLNATVGSELHRDISEHCSLKFLPNRRTCLHFFGTFVFKYIHTCQVLILVYNLVSVNLRRPRWPSFFKTNLLFSFSCVQIVPYYP